MPTRLIDSTPPPIAISCWPDMTCAEAKFTASRPEAQKRLICTPGTPSPKPATSAAARAMSPPASPTGSTQPITTSSISAGSSLLRSLHGGERLRGEIERGHLVQRAVGLAAAARRAHVVVDECVGHWRSPFLGVVPAKAGCRVNHVLPSQLRRGLPDPGSRSLSLALGAG